MSLLSIILSLSFFRLSSAQGAGGQTCAISEASSQCPLDGSDFSIYSSSEIECDANYDCCYCKSIECTDCELFKIDGDYGAAGVPEIDIHGDDTDGVKIECVGMLYDGTVP